MFKAGYKFKETHPTVNFIKNNHSVPNAAYSKNFTTDEKEAKFFKSSEDAKSTILDLMKDFGRDEDYRWTPVILDQETGKVTTLICSQWH